MEQRGPAVSDEALIAQARTGDTAAFDQLVLRHQQLVYAVAYRMLGDAHEAEEIAQEAFVGAYRALATFRHDAKLSTWLVAITMNLCRNRRRWWARRKQRVVASLDAPLDTAEGERTIDAPDPSPSPAERAQRREREQLIEAALQRLDAAHRSVIVLRDVQGYAYEEIAVMLRCRLGTVKSRINRAREQLRALLDGHL